MSSIFTRPCLPIMFRVRADATSRGAWGLLPSFILVVPPGPTVTLVFRFSHTDLSAVPGPSRCLRAGLSLSQTQHLPENRIRWTLPSFTSFVKSQALSWLSCPPIYNLTSVLLLCFITPGPCVLTLLFS